MGEDDDPRSEYTSRPNTSASDANTFEAASESGVNAGDEEQSSVLGPNGSDCCWVTGFPGTGSGRDSMAAKEPLSFVNDSSNS